MESKLGLKDNLSPEELSYRIEHLVFSQNMLNSFKRDKGEFADKYIRNIFWSDDTAQDKLYEENMSYGRDFHTMCQRIFMGIVENIDESDSIDISLKKDLKRVESIKRKYTQRYGKENIKFYPECSIELSNRLQVTLDLLVEIYEDKELSQINIWDWKMEKNKISQSFAKSRMQTIVYMYVCKESLAKELDYSKLRMYYYQPRINNNVMINYTEKEHIKNRETINSLINQIKSISKELD
ncbi:MAG: PD-(D/E)XK nuclease family protein [Peptostreptococcus sp.]|uniref:PD-(D/E)XK nuclease family protein n=1 Tax=Peptostreptococcus sp. TaxID=1262 RepID=UPI002FCB0C66